MGFNSQGKWVQEDQSVETPLNKLLSSSSEYIRNAGNGGTAYAARRGLINSSIAAGASTGAAIDKALPIASQDAAQTATNNLAMQNAGYANEQIDRTNAGQLKLAGVNNAAEKDRLTTSIAGTAALQGQSDAAQMARQTAAAKQQTELQKLVDAGQASREQASQLAALKLQAQTDTAARDRLNISTGASNQQAALQAALNANQTYQTAFDNLANNKDIPAATRDSYIKSLQATRDSGIDMIQQIYGVKLNWNSGSSGGKSTTATYSPIPETMPSGLTKKQKKAWLADQAAAKAKSQAAYG